MQFIYQIKQIYIGDSISKLEENKDYSHEEEGKSNNINEKENKNKAYTKSFHNDKEYDENRNNLKQSNRISKINPDKNINKNFINELENKNIQNNFLNETDRTPNKNASNHKNEIMNFEPKRTIYNINENNYENYIISDTQKSSKITNYNNEFNNEISNDYIQSTCTNNQFNVNNTHYNHYSNENNYKNEIKNNFEEHIPKHVYKEKSHVNNQNFQSFDNLDKRLFKKNSPKIDKNVYMTLNPNSNKRVMEITQANNINIINTKKNESYMERERLVPKKISVYEKELMDELITPNKLQTSNHSDVNSLRNHHNQIRKNNNSKNSFTYLNHVESRANNECGDKITNKNQNNYKQVKDLKEYKLSLKDKQNVNSSFNSEKPINVSNYKESTNFFSNESHKNLTNSHFNKLNNPLKSKVTNQTERKSYKINPIKIERNELYSDIEINQLNLFMGNPIKNKLEVNGQKIDFFFFHKLTNPTRNIEFDTIQKIKYINNLNIINERFVNISYEVIIILNI